MEAIRSSLYYSIRFRIFAPSAASGVGDLATIQPAGQADVSHQEIDPTWAFSTFSALGPSTASTAA